MSAWKPTEPALTRSAREEGFSKNRAHTPEGSPDLSLADMQSPHAKSPNFTTVGGRAKQRLARPFTPVERKRLEKRTRTLMDQRTQLDAKILAAVEEKKVTVQDWPTRHDLRKC